MSAIASTKKPRKKSQAVLLHTFNTFKLAAGKGSDSFFTPEYTSQLRFCDRMCTVGTGLFVTAANSNVGNGLSKENSSISLLRFNVHSCPASPAP